KIGVLAPESARGAVRELFLSHVIGGKGLSSRAEFARIVTGATPDVVLTGVETLAEVLGEDVVVVDVGGATTDVHSVVAPDPEAADVREEVVQVTPVTRTVEGDLGMRWSAPSTLQAADRADPSLAESDHALLTSQAQHRHDHPGWLPATEQDQDVDELLARLAVGTALQRHAGRSRVVLGEGGKVVERTGTDLRRVGLVVGSGGVLRHGRDGIAERVLRWSTTGGWQLPERPRLVVDEHYVLAAVGLLARTHPAAARKLAGTLPARR
ncbi:MAG: glutamate mutase L, partial [Nocardioides sp.]|nr:glutamate mutase L [Nocardioides sp.]